MEPNSDDLLDDLMNIVQNENESIKTSNELGNFNHQDDNSCDIDDEDEYDNDDGVDEEEILIDEMLEKPIDILDEKDQPNYYTYDKLQIKNIYWRGCQDTILPEGWVQVTHACGMPLFLNRQARVCTLSRPYFIGQSSARKHDIPLSAIPCLAYRKRKESVEKQMQEHQQAKMQANANKCPYKYHKQDLPSENITDSTEPGASVSNPNAPDLKLNKKVVVSIQTNEEKLKENILTGEEVHNYCKQLFEFDVIKVKKFKTWGDRKKFIRKSKQKKFPENAKMLKIQTKTQKGINKELNINMTNKSALSILYEYANQVFKTNPRFEIQEKENPKDPFQAVCYINDNVCGRGSGNSKKAAKNNSAEAALCVLIPDFKGQIADTKKNNDEIYSFFDSYNVEHTHVYNLSQKLGAPLPYDVLLTCLKYNLAINMSRNRKQFIEEEIKPIKYRNCLYRMKLAQYDVEVNCTKKKEGRQLAAQKILKMMHPHINTWGSMLRLYGAKMAESVLKMENQNDGNEDSNDSYTAKKSEDDKKTDDSSSIQKQQATQRAKPNKELLEKLKQEMRKLKKPSNASATTSNEASCSSKTDTSSQINPNKHDTLLTIPPLLLGNTEFNLTSSNFLRTGSKNSETEPEKTNSDDMISFSDSSNKKRKIDNENDEDFDSNQRSSNYFQNYKTTSNDEDTSDSDSDDDSNNDEDDDEDEDSFDDDNSFSNTNNNNYNDDSTINNSFNSNND